MKHEMLGRIEKYHNSRQTQPLEVFCKKKVLRNFEKFTGKHLCESLFFNKVEACNFIKKETLAQVFSCEFREISKNTSFTEHIRVTSSITSSLKCFDIRV